MIANVILEELQPEAPVKENNDSSVNRMLTHENVRRHLGKSSCCDPVLQLVFLAILQLGLGKCASHTHTLMFIWPREEHDPWPKITLEG